ncbi:MAG TPA: spirocyclase AveC family protein, partial [Acidimicrobiales bacterium]
MSTGLTPLLRAAIGFAYVGGLVFVALGVVLSVRRRRLHPLLLVCIAAISFSWIEAPYDWAMYAQFPPAIPRMPSWWPLDMTWGGLPASVPPGYISYFVLPAVIAAALGRRASARFGWRRPLTLLTAGLVAGFAWALFFNAFVGARLGVFHYGRVIPGLALWEGTKHQYPVYDAVAMGVQVMVFAYILGRTDPEGRTVIDTWADGRASGRLRSSLL